MSAAREDFPPRQTPLALDGHPWRRRLREAAARLGLLGFGLCVGLLVAELALRIHDPLGQRLLGERILLPYNVRYVITQPGNPKLEPVVVNTRNALGFRGEDPPADFDRRLTVLAVGGSTTECRHLNDGKDWPSLLGRRLAAQFRDLWINNAGLDGHSTFGHVRLMEQRVVRLRPKLVLFLFGINDLARNNLKYQDGALTDRPDLGAWAWLVSTTARHSVVASTLLNLRRGMAAAQARLDQPALDLRSLPVARPGRRRSEQIVQSYREEFLPAYRERIERLLQLSRQAGARPVLLTQPALYGPAVDDATGIDLGFIEVDPEDGVNGRLAWKILEAYNDVVREVGRAEGVPVVDLARRLPKSSRLFYDFVHFTNEGAAAVAESVAGELCGVLAREFGAFQTAACP